MSNFTDINGPRVDRILKTLDMIQTSARSNRATPSEQAALLNPVRAALGADAEVPPASPAPVPCTAPAGKVHWDNVIHMARTAPLPDLTKAMTVFLDRLEQHMHESKS